MLIALSCGWECMRTRFLSIRWSACCNEWKDKGAGTRQQNMRAVVFCDIRGPAWAEGLSGVPGRHREQPRRGAGVARLVAGWRARSRDDAAVSNSW